MSAIQGEVREFMRHAYTALFNGGIMTFSDEAKKAVIWHVTDDLCTVVRTMDKEEQDRFLRQIQIRMTGGN